MAVAIAAASLAVVSPPASDPAAAYPNPADLPEFSTGLTCNQLNELPGRPTEIYLVPGGLWFDTAASDSGPSSGNTYRTDDKIRIKAKFSLDIRDHGVRGDLWDDIEEAIEDGFTADAAKGEVIPTELEPLHVRFMLGGQLKHADVVPRPAGDPQTTLTFEYVLASGDRHSDGNSATPDVYIPANSIVAEDYSQDKRPEFPAGLKPTASLQTLSGPCGGTDVSHNAVLHPNEPGSPSVTKPPKIMSEPPSGDTYYVGEEIVVRIEFDGPVEVSSESPSIQINVGGQQRQADYVAPAVKPNIARSRLHFSYTVQSSDADTDGISADDGQVTGGGIRAVGDGLAVTPYFMGLAAQADYLASTGGDPTVAKHLVDGSQSRPAAHSAQDCESPNPSDEDLVALCRSSTHMLSYGTRILSDPASGTTYTAGEHIIVRAEFTKPVMVPNGLLRLRLEFANCTPQVVNELDDQDRLYENFQNRQTLIDDYETFLKSDDVQCIDRDGDRIVDMKYAKYWKGSGQTRLLFRYEVTSDDVDRDGIVVPQGEFTYFDATADPPSDAAEITQDNLDSIIAAVDEKTVLWWYSDVFEKPLKYQKSNGQAVPGDPKVDSIDVTSMPESGDTYGFGETITVKVTFSEAVHVSGMPLLKLRIGDDVVDAVYNSGDRSSELYFDYEVKAGDEDTDGISIDADSLRDSNAPGAIVAVDDGNNAIGTHAGLDNLSGHKVDSGSPKITSLSIDSTPPNGGAYYGEGSHIDIKVSYNKPVEASGILWLDLGLGSGNQPPAQRAHYDASASDADSDDSTIVFRYTVDPGDGDPDGISIESGSIDGGGTIQNADRSQDADKTFSKLATQSDHRVETVMPTVNSVALVSDGECDAGPYQFKDIVCVKATFSEVVWIGTDSGDPSVELLPQIEVDVGNRHVPAVCDCIDGSNGLSLLFKYTVEGGDLDEDGISVGRDSMSDGGASMTDQAGNRADLLHDAIAPSNSSPDNTLDAIVATVTGPTLVGGPLYNEDRYGIDQIITVEFQFSENVDVSRAPQLALQLNYFDDGNVAVTATRQAAYNESLDCNTNSNPCRLRFTYQVQAGDIDPDGISIAENAFNTDTNSNKITDASRNPSDLRHGALETQPGHKVDAAGPLITEILVSPDGVHTIGEVITFAVAFDEEIEVDTTNVDTTDTPTSNDGLQLRFSIGTQTAYAEYTSGGTGTQRLVFDYTVVEGDFDENGITIPASNAIEKRGAVVKDPYENLSSLRNDTMSDLSDHKVDGVRPYITSGPTITSDPPYKAEFGNDTYGEGSFIEITVGFNEPVVPTGGEPTIDLLIGDTTYQAIWEPPDGYVTNSPLSEVTFRYEIGDQEDDIDGISVVADSVTDAMSDRPGNAPKVNGQDNLEHRGITNASGHKVETTAPTIESVVISEPPVDDTFRRGDAIMVTVSFSEKVVVTGEAITGEFPKIRIDIDNDSQQEIANFMGGSGTTALVFAYGVTSSDVDTDGVGIDANSLYLDGGRIADLPGNDAELDHGPVAEDDGYLVDGTLNPFRPFVASNGLSIKSIPAKHGTYAGGEAIVVEVTFSEAVTTGYRSGGRRPYVVLTVGNQPRHARYESGSRSTKLLFQYTVNSGDGVIPVADRDQDGVSINQVEIELNGGSIDATVGGTAASIFLPGLNNYTGQSEQQVDGVAPTIVEPLAITSVPMNNGEYVKDEVVEIGVEFDTPVLVPGTPRLGIKIGTSTRYATLASPTTIDDTTNTTVLTFSYKVQGGDRDSDGISIDEDSLKSGSPSGAITDLVGNPADLSHAEVLEDQNHKVDGGPPSTTPVIGGGGGGGGANPDPVDIDDVRLSVRVERIGGIDRFDTAKLIAERFVREVSRDDSLPTDKRTVDTVVIASGKAFPDALTASALAGSALSPIALSSTGLAGSRNAPLLLTEPNELPPSTKAFLVENEIEHVYLVGGTGAISSGVAATIAALTSVTNVTRFGGADRYATSVSIASEVSAAMGGAGEFCGTTMRTALLAVGDDFADALAFAPIAARGPHPLLLTRRDELPDSVREYFEAAAELDTVEHVVIAGGAFAVSDTVADELVAMGLNVTRLGGEDRFDTSVRIAAYVLRAASSGQGACLDTNRVAFATGLVYADGLAGGPLMAQMRAPTVLLWPNAVPKQVDGFLSWHLLDHENLTLNVLGGTKAISHQTVRTVRVAVQRVLDLD